MEQALIPRVQAHHVATSSSEYSHQRVAQGQHQGMLAGMLAWSAAQRQQYISIHKPSCL
jgi:hypothetical protein